MGATTTGPDNSARPSGAASACLRAGRIVEVNVHRMIDLEDVESLHAEIRIALRHAAPGPVICADYRFAAPVSRAVARVWSRAMREANPEIVRSGLLLDPANTMFNLQIERVVRCAMNPERRFFTKLDELCDWIGEVLSEPERDTLHCLFVTPT